MRWHRRSPAPASPPVNLTHDSVAGFDLGYPPGHHPDETREPERPFHIRVVCGCGAWVETRSETIIAAAFVRTFNETHRCKL